MNSFLFLIKNSTQDQDTLIQQSYKIMIHTVANMNE